LIYYYIDEIRLD